jgi:hypothetical protein
MTLVDADRVAYEFGGSETLAIRSLPARFEPVRSAPTPSYA